MFRCKQCQFHMNCIVLSYLNMFNIVSILLHPCNLVYQCLCHHSFLATGTPLKPLAISYTNKITISFSTLSHLRCHGILPCNLLYRNFHLKPLADFLYKHHYIIIIIVFNTLQWHGFLSFGLSILWATLFLSHWLISCTTNITLLCGSIKKIP